MNGKMLLVASLTVSLIACAPRAGIPPVVYEAQSGDVLAYIAQVGVQIQPGSGFNYFSVETIGPSYVTFSASATLGTQILFGGVRETRMTFTVLQNGPYVNVAGSINTDQREYINAIFQKLDEKFKRAPESPM